MTDDNGYRVKVYIPGEDNKRMTLDDLEGVRFNSTLELVKACVDLLTEEEVTELLVYIHETRGGN